MKIKLVFKSVREQQAFIDSVWSADLELPVGMEVTFLPQITKDGHFAVTLWCHAIQRRDEGVT